MRGRLRRLLWSPRMNCRWLRICWSGRREFRRVSGVNDVDVYIPVRRWEPLEEQPQPGQWEYPGRVTEYKSS